jgi:hypothetical protein
MIDRRSLLIGAALGVAFGPPMAMAQPSDKAALLAELMKLEAASWQYLKVPTYRLWRPISATTRS